MTDRIARRVVVSGQVQGVGFRFATVAEAERLGVDGWVRNRADGAVEVEFAGPRGAAEGLTSWLRHGPPSARVDGVEVQEIADPPVHSGFRIR